jgi:transcriptional regulator with XRE-family HTH domain
MTRQAFRIFERRPAPQPRAPGPFAAWVAERMAARGLTYGALARSSGVAPATVLRIVRGDREPLLSTAAALVRGLGERYVLE